MERVGNGVLNTFFYGCIEVIFFGFANIHVENQMKSANWSRCIGVYHPFEPLLHDYQIMNCRNTLRMGDCDFLNSVYIPICNDSYQSNVASERQTWQSDIYFIYIYISRFFPAVSVKPPFIKGFSSHLTRGYQFWTDFLALITLAAGIPEAMKVNSSENHRRSNGELSSKLWLP